MAKVKQLFEIDDFELQENKILVDIFKGGKPQTVTIPRASYEKWLSDSGRLDWVTDSCTYNGEHEQKTGTLTIDYYWFDVCTEKKSDLYDWIVLKWISEGVFNIEQPLANIMGGHFFTALNAAI
jgi:hypothetical protein